MLRNNARESRVLTGVADNGVGMTPNLTTNAFGLFAQVERTSNRAAGGYRLGLTMVESLVELHGGNVTYNNEDLCHGCKF